MYCPQQPHPLRRDGDVARGDAGECVAAGGIGEGAQRCALHPDHNGRERTSIAFAYNATLDGASGLRGEWLRAGWKKEEQRHRQQRDGGSANS